MSFVSQCFLGGGAGASCGGEKKNVGIQTKVAVLHNFMDNIGGAERVSLVLARELGADIYTTNIDQNKIEKMGFSDVLPRIFSIGKVPLNAPWRQQLTLWRFRRLSLAGEYDFFIIAGDWAMSGAFNNTPNLWYVHSPIREIWDLKHYVRSVLVSFWKRPLFDVWVSVNRYLNRRYIKKVNRIVCNSVNTRKRVERFLKREAIVIHPPIDTTTFRYGEPRGYWLSVNRLIRHKRIDLQMEAFFGLPEERLIVVGSYEKSQHFQSYAAQCMKNKPSNVEIRSWVSQAELIDLYAACKGFITTSQDEDFGMNVVEAMAAGKPVIAPNEGGYNETVLHGQTGILIDDIDAEKIREAVRRLGEELEGFPEKYKEACRAQADRFSSARFIQRIRAAMN